jgi:hypothetical protein
MTITMGAKVDLGSCERCSKSDVIPSKSNLLESVFARKISSDIGYGREKLGEGK